ncbi:arylsulfatase [Alloalcanivorax marinus]|uniref:arylsulfatase n=1 Tax=Alloalcanivorax marinus TaxID=1177169 RepID=UPI0019330084|nr:arylsulfatase [Alloalcanivorax marinus]MBL7251256.1 arylsulfatase [Alloalcanivorax marinus]
MPRYFADWSRILIALSFSCVATTTFSAVPDTKPRPNVLVIVADDLGYSDIGAFGGEIDTPNLNDLANEGRVFSDFYVAPACSPTRAQLFSGADHHLVGLGTMAENLPLTPGAKGKPGYEGELNDKALSLPQILLDHGYHTYMTGKWHLGSSRANRPGARGFERSFALLDGAANHFNQDGAFIPPGQQQMPKAQYTENDQPTDLPKDFYSSDFYTSKMLSYLKERHDSDDEAPFFAMLSYTAPHWPLQAPTSYIEKYQGRYDSGYQAIRRARLERMKALGLTDATDTVSSDEGLAASWRQLPDQERAREARRMEIYAAMVDNMDHNIGRVINYLESSGDLENTVILFFSDNGADGTTGKGLFEPTFAYYDNTMKNMGTGTSYVMYGPHWAHVSSTPLRGTKTMTSEGGISSPLIISMPGVDGDGAPNRSVINVMDVLPTILDIARIPVPGGKYNGRDVITPMGRSWLPMISGDIDIMPEQDHAVGWELFSRRGIRQGDWKMLWIDPPNGTGQWQLYDLNADRGETRDLYKENPKVAKRLKKEWDNYVERVGVQLNPYPWPEFIR